MRKLILFSLFLGALTTARAELVITSQGDTFIAPSDDPLENFKSAIAKGILEDKMGKFIDKKKNEAYEQLKRSLDALEELKKQGMTETEFQAKKEQILNDLRQFQAKLKEKIGTLPFEEFERLGMEAVQELFNDEKIRVAFLNSDQKETTLSKKEAELLLRIPFNLLSKVNEKEIDDEDLEDPFLPPLPPVLPDTDVTDYFQLPLGDSEKQIIAYIITSMADKNVFQLLLDKSDMEKKGDRINHVHPLRFIGYACSDPKLVRGMRQFKKNPFKWDNFISGFARRMREEATRNNLQRFVPSMAEFLSKDAQEMSALIQQGDYEGFVRYLISS